MDPQIGLQVLAECQKMIDTLHRLEAEGGAKKEGASESSDGGNSPFAMRGGSSSEEEDIEPVGKRSRRTKETGADTSKDTAQNILEPPEKGMLSKLEAIAESFFHDRIPYRMRPKMTKKLALTFMRDMCNEIGTHGLVVGHLATWRRTHGFELADVDTFYNFMSGFVFRAGATWLTSEERLRDWRVIRMGQLKLQFAPTVSMDLVRNNPIWEIVEARGIKNAQLREIGELIILLYRGAAFGQSLAEIFACWTHNLRPETQEQLPGLEAVDVTFLQDIIRTLQKNPCAVLLPYVSLVVTSIVSELSRALDAEDIETPIDVDKQYFDHRNGWPLVMVSISLTAFTKARADPSGSRYGPRRQAARPAAPTVDVRADEPLYSGSSDEEGDPDQTVLTLQAADIPRSLRHVLDVTQGVRLLKEPVRTIWNELAAGYDPSWIACKSITRTLKVMLLPHVMRPPTMKTLAATAANFMVELVRDGLEPAPPKTSEADDTFTKILSYIAHDTSSRQLNNCRFRRPVFVAELSDEKYLAVCFLCPFMDHLRPGDLKAAYARAKDHLARKHLNVGSRHEPLFPRGKDENMAQLKHTVDLELLMLHMQLGYASMAKVQRKLGVQTYWFRDQVIVGRRRQPPATRTNCSS